MEERGGRVGWTPIELRPGKELPEGVEGSWEGGREGGREVSGEREGGEREEERVTGWLHLAGKGRHGSGWLH